ncbi:MAG: PAS domain-containing protein [Bacteroidota bacterium]
MQLDQPPSDKAYHFLQGGGEMGELTRSFNWEDSPIGTPDHWPQGLRTTLGLLLHSAFPMFLFWGSEMICFYNDAFRPSLGMDGKHPAIGKKGRELWSEIWVFIGPLLEGVKTSGKPVWYENELVPFYRNGRIEEIYWTFSYSPAYGDSGDIDGVFVTCTETTEAVKNLERLKESEDRFRTMAEGTDILIAVSDETSNAIYFNNAWVKLTGRPMEDLLAFGWADLVHEEDRDKFLKIYLDAFEKRVAFTGEFRIKNKDGEYSWLLAKGPPRLRPDGSFAGYISASLDITERKKSEKAFAENEQRSRSLVASAPFPIGVYVGREMQVELANQSILDIWGKGNNVIGKLFHDVLPELDSQEVLKQLDEVYTTGIPFHIRNQHLDLEVNGKTKPYYFNYSLTPLFDDEGKVYGVMNTGADVTDLNIAKQKIEQSEKNFRNMIMQAPVAMCILTGPQFIIEIANDLMVELWGKPRELVMHRPVFDALPDAREQGLEQLMENVFTTGEAFTASDMPVTLLRKGKWETVYQNFVYEPYRDTDGAIIGVLAISIDVTAQVLARQRIEEIVAERTRELAAANNNLQKSNADLAQFAYIASHDLQEPVRKVSTFTQMLESHLGQPDARAKNYLDKIKKSSSRMLALIKGVLAYSQLSGMNKSFIKVNLQKTLDDIITDFELLIEQKQAHIRAVGLPEIEAIPLHMSQLFGNLISNALKFTRPGVKPEVNITCAELAKEEIKPHPDIHKHTPWYRITVQDNGIGFSQEYSQQIFSIFQRLHGKNDYEGTGIGLAMCQKIVQNHCGEIHAIGEPGKGSTFIITLPARQTGEKMV